MDVCESRMILKNHKTDSWELTLIRIVMRKSCKLQIKKLLQQWLLGLKRIVIDLFTT